MRIVYNKLTKSLITIIVDDMSITHFPLAEACVIQAEPSELIVMALALGLEMEELIENFELNNIEYAMTPQMELVLKDRAFGINFANTLIDKIKNQDTLTLAQRQSLLTKIHLFLTLITIGDIQAAKAVFNNYTTDTVLTSARKQWVLDQLVAAGY